MNSDKEIVCAQAMSKENRRKHEAEFLSTLKKNFTDARLVETFGDATLFSITYACGDTHQVTLHFDYA